MVTDWLFIIHRIHLNSYPQGLQVQTLDLNKIGHFTPLTNPAGFEVASAWVDVQLSSFVIITVMGQGTIYAQP